MPPAKSINRRKHRAPNRGRDRSPTPTIPAHSIGWTGGRAADALFGAGGGVGATVVDVYVWLSGVGIGWLSLTVAWGAGLADLRGGRVWLDPPKPQDRAIDGPAVKPTTAPATAPIGPSTTAPDNAPKAASPTRSWAIAAEDISARVSTTNANVFFIRVPCLSPAQHFRLPGLPERARHLRRVQVTGGNVQHPH